MSCLLTDRRPMYWFNPGGTLPTCILAYLYRQRGHVLVKVKVKADKFWMGNPISELQGVACHMGSHSITCHPTQANTPCLNPSQWRLVLDLPTPKGRKAELTWVTWLRPGRKSNPRLLDQKYDALTAAPLGVVYHVYCMYSLASHYANCQVHGSG